MNYLDFIISIIVVTTSLIAINAMIIYTLMQIFLRQFRTEAAKLVLYVESLNVYQDFLQETKDKDLFEAVISRTDKERR
jgi:hypothetical protein